MTLNLTIQELSIILAIRNINPTLFTQEFLKYSGIVPADWELAQPPLLNSQIAQVAFTNGISLIAQLDTITFSESVQTKAIGEVKIPNIARKYVERLPNADYQAVVIKIRNFLTLEDKSEDAIRNYIFSTFLSPDIWHEVDKKPMGVALNLTYTLEEGQLNFIINEAKLQIPDKPPQFAVLFTGNFPHEIAGDTVPQRLQHLSQLIDNWHKSLENYKIIVNNFLLKKANNRF